MKHNVWACVCEFKKMEEFQFNIIFHNNNCIIKNEIIENIYSVTL